MTPYPQPAPADLAVLHLADPAALFDAPGGGGAAIAAALRAVLDNPAVQADPAQYSRLRLLAEAGRILLANPAHLAHAIHLTRTAAPDLADTAPLAHIRLIAMWQLADRDGVVAEADRVLTLRHHSVQERRILRSTIIGWGIERLLPMRMDYLPDYWPDLEAAIADPCATLMRELDVTVIHPVITRLLQSVWRSRDADEPDFRRRLLWGAEWHRRILFVRGVCVQIMQDRKLRPITRDEAALLDFDAKLNGLFPNPDLSPLTDICAAGRSVVLVGAHAGLGILWDFGLRRQPFPFTGVSHIPRPVPAHRPNDSHLATTGPDTVMAFAKLAKSMKKQPRIVRIFPDGAHGDRAMVPVLGKPVPIGRGAAVLAWQGKADVLFLDARWDGDKLAVVLDPGPRAIDHHSSTDFEEAFNRFYATCLERIVLGPPEDMVPDGGFWPHLTK